MKIGWDQDRDMALTELWDRGLTASEIAAEIGTTRNAVLGRVYRLGLTPRDPQICRSLQANRIKSKYPQRKRKLRPARAAAMTAPPLAPEVKEFILGQGIPLLDLPPNGCHWPVNEAPRNGTHLFCGAPALDGLPYCECHEAMAHGGRAA